MEFKGFLYSFLITTDKKTVDITIIVNIIKVIFCDEMLVIINDSLSLLILI